MSVNRDFMGDVVNARVVPLEGVPVGYSFARKFPKAGNCVFQLGNTKQTIEAVPKFVVTPRTGYGMWVDGGVEPQRHLCYPTPSGEIEFVSPSTKLTFDGQLASIVGERIFIVKQKPRPEVDVANLADFGEYVHKFTNFENTTSITNLSVFGVNRMVVTCKSNSDLPHNAVRVTDVETRRQLFTISSKTALDAVMNDEQNLLIVTTFSKTQMFDIRQQTAAVFAVPNEPTARIVALTRDDKLILSGDGGLVADVLDIRTRNTVCRYMGAHCMTWDKYNNMLCGVHYSGASVMVYDLSTRHPHFVPFVE